MEALGVAVLVMSGVVLALAMASAVWSSCRQQDLAQRAALRSRERELQRRGA